MKNQIIKLLSSLGVLLVVIFLAGCSTTKTLTDKHYKAKSKDSHIEVVELNQVKRPYEIIGIVNAESILGVNGLKNEARSIGADAITVPEMRSAQHGIISEDFLEAKALKWK
jgi:hypothetical protein